MANGDGNEYDAGTTEKTISIEINYDINGDGKVSAGDLAIIASNYGKNIDSEDWQKIRKADVDVDVDVDGKIGFHDLVLVATKILE